METGRKIRVSDLDITFGKLSNEVLMLIFSFLPRNNELVNIALVSTRFRDCVEPFLYQTINVLIPCTTSASEPFNLMMHYTVDSDRRSLSATTQILGNGSHLIRYVTAIDISTCCCDQFESLSAQYDLLDLLPGLKELSLRPAGEELDMSQLKSLEVLRVGSSVFECIDHDACGQHNWVNLFDFLACHFWMPSLRYLEIETDMSSQYDGNNSLPEGGRGTSSITDLCIIQSDLISYSDVAVSLLSHICQAAKALQRIIIQTEMHDRDAPVGWFEWAGYLQSIELAIHPHWDFLTDLFIIGLFRPHTEDIVLDLINCRSLIKLAIPSSYLVGSSDDSESFAAPKRLPGSLEQLQLQFDSDATCEETGHSIGGLAASKQTCLPALRIVITWVHIKQDYNSGGHGTGCFACQRDRDTSDFKKVGINYQLIMQEGFSGTPLGRTSFSTFAAFPGADYIPVCCNGLNSCC
ncbi:hypothetical protein MMC27_007382 [Xylographa pallens]|nr:hypothetical protein [Xylographa pallens]